MDVINHKLMVKRSHIRKRMDVRGKANYLLFLFTAPKSCIIRQTHSLSSPFTRLQCVVQLSVGLHKCLVLDLQRGLLWSGRDGVATKSVWRTPVDARVSFWSILQKDLSIHHNE